MRDYGWRPLGGQGTAEGPLRLPSHPQAAEYHAHAMFCCFKLRRKLRALCLDQSQFYTVCCMAVWHFAATRLLSIVYEDAFCSHALQLDVQRISIVT